MDSVKVIPNDMLKQYIIYANRHDHMGTYRVYLKNIQLTFQRVPDEKKSTKNKLVYTSNEKKLIPLAIGFTENYLEANLFLDKNEVKMNMESIAIMNSVLKIKKGTVLKWDYVQVGDLLNQLKKENKLSKNIVKIG